MDLNDTESMNSSIYPDQNTLDDLNNNIKNQYIEFNDLGIDLIENINNTQIVNIILEEFVDYVNEYITPVMNFKESEIFGTLNKTNLGLKLYNFLIIDCHITIIPNFLDINHISTFLEFERFYNISLKHDPSLFKANFIKSIQKILNNIQKLEKLDKTIKYDKNYKLLVKKYQFYIESINFGNIDNFLDNYFNPMLSKNIDDILIRIK